MQCFLGSFAHLHHARDPMSNLRRLKKAKPTRVDHFVDDLCHLAFQERVEHFDQKQQTGTEDSQRACQENQAHREVRQAAGDKQMPTCRDTTGIRQEIM